MVVSLNSRLESNKEEEKKTWAVLAEDGARSVAASDASSVERTRHV